MIVVLKQGIKEEEIQTVIGKIKELGYFPHVLRGVLRTVIACIGDERGKAELKESLEALDPVEKVMLVLTPYKLVSRETRPEGTVVKIGEGVEIGGREIIVIAGPCSVENRDQVLEIAKSVKESGAKALRGGAYKPRTSPYSFQGLGEEGLKILSDVKKETGLPIVTEIMDTKDVELFEKYTDVFQVGTRNIQNFPLLKRLGKVSKPVLLKRGMMTTIEEFLMAAEYVVSGGNPNVILCERGIRTFDSEFTRNILDLSSIPVLKKETHLPIIVDPSHGTGRRDLVIPMSKAAIAAGADGLLIEVHPKPEEALSDGYQSITLEMFKKLMDEIKPFLNIMEKKV